MVTGGHAAPAADQRTRRTEPSDETPSNVQWLSLGNALTIAKTDLVKDSEIASGHRAVACEVSGVREKASGTRRRRLLIPSGAAGRRERREEALPFGRGIQ
jgi:hypothetical protein